MMSKKQRSAPTSPAGDEGRPKVHFTRFGGRYVNADELLRSEAVRDQIRSMAELFRNDPSRDGSEDSGPKDS